MSFPNTDYAAIRGSRNKLNAPLGSKRSLIERSPQAATLERVELWDEKQAQNQFEGEISIAGKTARNVENDGKSLKAKLKLKGVPAKRLTTLGYSICLFPEQPEAETVVEYYEEKIRKKSVREIQAMGPFTTKNSPSFEEHYVEDGVERLIREPVESVPDKSSLLTLETIVEKPNEEELHEKNLKVGVIPKKKSFSSRLMFLASFVAFAFSLNNVYQFPLQLYKYGGMFLVPYTFFTIILGYPLLVMQLTLGQYTRAGILKMWDCLPISRGIGLVMLLLCIIHLSYANIFGAYSLVYMCKSLFTPNNFNESNNLTNNVTFYFFTSQILGGNFIRGELLQVGTIKWWLVFALLICCLVLYLGISHREFSACLLVVSYYLLVIIFLIAATVLNYGQGFKTSRLGLRSDFFTAEFWYVAAAQVFMELGLFLGVPIFFGSCCDHKNLVHIDAIYLCVVNYTNSLVCFLILFSFIKSDVNNRVFIDWNVGFGVLYIVVSHYGAKFINLVFVFLFLIVVGTQIAVGQTVVDVIMSSDRFTAKKHKVCVILATLVVSGASFIGGLFYSTDRGVYWANLVHTTLVFHTAVPLMCIFSFSVIYLYKVDKYFRNIGEMSGVYPGLVYATFLRLLVPFMAILVIFGKIGNPFWVNPITADCKSKNQGIPYLVLGWCFFGSIMVLTLGWCIIYMVHWKSQHGSFKGILGKAVPNPLTE